MNFRPTTRRLIAAIIGLGIMGSGSAMAGGDRYGYDRYKYRGHHERQHHDHYYPYKKKKNHHHDDDDEKLLIGLLMGGVVGYAISQSRQSPAYERPYYYPPVDAAPQPAPVPQGGYNGAYGPSSCLQEREYQTKVIVGGKEVDAYGTACLQPDGSWRRGPAQLVSY